MEEFEKMFDSDNEFNTNEIDESSISIKALENLAIIPMDLSMELILEWVRKGKLVLDPNFQRREVWDIKKKSKFIESLILGIPIPSILLADDRKNNQYIVIDGKQRISTIVQFMAIDNDNKGFRLKDLEILKELENFNYKKMLSDGNVVDLLSSFQNAILKSSIVRNYTEEQLYFIFNRLNTGSVPLSTQELRQSLFPGRFLDYVNEYSYDNVWIKSVLGIAKPDKRMKDVELVVRYISFKYFLSSYSNSLNEFFNNTCIYFNKTWDENKDAIINECLELNNAISFVFDNLGKDSFRAYLQNKETKEWKFGPINRPMFDLMSVVFSNPNNRKIINDNNINLRTLIIDLFTKNDIFYDAFLPTTHSKDKTDKRFDIFLKELSAY